ncbi:MAG: carboxypeptidase regulatory-like domain-containing protein [Candidatus Cloacimonadaceae bacterium]
MKRITFIILLMVLGLTTGLSAHTVTVGEIAGHNGYLPVYTEFGYCYAQQLYQRSLINYEGTVSKIRFFHHHSGLNSFAGGHNWVIYLGHTTRDSFTSRTDWEPIANLTQVFAGTIPSHYGPDPEEWLEISLDTPFFYNNTDNLVVAIHAVFNGRPSDVYWGCFAAGLDSGLCFSNRGLNPDPSNPPVATWITANIPTMQLVFPDTEAPQAPCLVYPQDNTALYNGYHLKWQLPQGSADVNGYDVYIDGTPVSENQVPNRYVFNGLTAGAHTWQVVAHNDIGASPPSETGTFEVISGVEIGNGNQDYPLPVGEWDYSYSQTIYLQSEIGIADQPIRKLSYYWDGWSSSGFSSNWVIYLGHTPKATFTHNRDWVPVSHMTKVFDGPITFKAYSNYQWIEIELDTPFLYNNTDNLVIAVYKNSPQWSYHFSNTLTPGHNRSIYYSEEWGVNPNPFSPPRGELCAARPNIRIKMEALPTQPILVVETTALDFGPVTRDCPSDPRNVTLFNYGAGNLNLTESNFSFIGPNASEFAISPLSLPISLGSMQRLQIPIYVTGVTGGEISATLCITYNGEQHDVALSAKIMPAGNIVIGTGSAIQVHPFGTGYYERSAAIYTADQLAGPGLIDMLAWDCSSTSDRVIPYKIFLRNTTDTFMTPETWPSFVFGMTQVKQGSYTPDTTGWQEFQLDTPFVYTGGNLIVAVETTYGSYDAGGHTFRYSGTGLQMRHQHWGTQEADSEWLGRPDNHVPNIMLHLVSNMSSDLAALSISGKHLPAAGELTHYSVQVRNNSLETLSNYIVKLFGPEEQEIASVTGPPLNSLQSLNVLIPWTPGTAGPSVIYGKVELDADTFAGNNQTPPLQLTILPANNHTVTIGTGNKLERHPMDFGEPGSIFETIYYADELGFGSGTITSLTLYNHFSVNVGSKHTKIYLGNTGRVDLIAGPFQASELSLVFDGNIEYPQGENAINITFQTPYMYTGGNLVALFCYRGYNPPYHANQHFKCQSRGCFRSLYLGNVGTHVDENNFPSGFSSGVVPQTTFAYTTDFVQNDLRALGLVGNLTPTVGVAASYTFHLTNNGEATQSNYTLKLMDSNQVELASLAGPPIGSQQSLEVVIPWTPVTQGAISIYGKIEFAQDEVPLNNCTATLNLEVKPTDVSAITIGAGEENGYLPLDLREYTGLFETLYYPDELGGFTGLITALQFYNDFDSSTNNIPISIYMGTTTMNDLTAGWIPGNQLVPVFTGTIDLPSGTNVINIPLDEPFPYADGHNLVVAIHKHNLAPCYYHNPFKCQRTERRRSLYSDYNYDYSDTTAPPAGNITTLFPKTTFTVIAGGMGQISGIVTGANNQPLRDVRVSLNGGAIHTSTNDAGQYLLPHVFASSHTIHFNTHGYQEHTQHFTLAEDEQLVINASLQLLPQVSVNGTVLANDTGAGHPGALIQLSGFESYQANTNSAGVFTLPAVFAEQTYDYIISAPGYSVVSGQVTVESINLDMGTFTLEELGFAPVSVLATRDNDAEVVEIAWLAPDSGIRQINESFEGENFPPAGWTQIIHNSALPYSDIYPTWSRAGTTHIGSFNITPTDGSFQAGLTWSYYVLNEWLITPLINCQPNTQLSFDSYVYLGSPLGDNYYVKASTDGGASWTVLWEAAQFYHAWNQYSAPITIDLSDYSGTQLKIAFHAYSAVPQQGVRPAWFIDNVHIGAEDGTLSSGAGALTDPPLRASSHHSKGGGSRALTGYLVYRLKANQELDQASWVSLNTEPTAALSLTDPDWADLPDGNYRWAVRATYSGDLISMPVLSNMLRKGGPRGTIAGTVRNEAGEPIVGATLTNTSNSCTTTTTTDSEGAYCLEVPTGPIGLRVSAEGYQTMIKTNVIIHQDQLTMLNIVLRRGTAADDPQFPVVATALNGNYPNPFNPETTIRYSVKEAGRVKLEVYNIKGQLVRTLVDKDHTTGCYTRVFDARDNRGRSISSGVYLVRMSAPGYQKTFRIMLMK